LDISIIGHGMVLKEACLSVKDEGDCESGGKCSLTCFFLCLLLWKPLFKFWGSGFSSEAVVLMVSEHCSVMCGDRRRDTCTTEMTPHTSWCHSKHMMTNSFTSNPNHLNKSNHTRMHVTDHSSYTF